MASANRRRASSSSTPVRPWDYEVFLSFRGEDTRRNFTDHLYAALIRKGIVTFRDDEGLSRGEEIAPSLVTAIEKSRCALVILSKHYAHSKWCLEELAKIMECRVKMGLIVYPVFYHVDPSDVRHQRGSYGEALAEHERKRLGHQTQRLRAALTEVANLSGWHLDVDGYESTYIKEITHHILKQFTREPFLYVDKNLVGMDDHSEEIISQMIDPLSNDVRMIGIYGLGGIGKTTIAKVVYNQIASLFMITSFIANVREDSKSRGLLHLQKQLLHEILPSRKNFIGNVDEGIHMIKNRLCFKKVLLVLDDVNDLEQLEALAGDCNWFGPGSRIIVTTRDRHLLNVHKMNSFYEVKVLKREEAVELFSWHAFGQGHPKEGYETLSHSMVRCVDRLPLGLKVLGRFLEIFLDVACFFNGEDKDRVTRTLDACNFSAEIGIGVLSDKCLIDIFDNNISMHTLLQQMGRDIVRQKYPEDPENGADCSCLLGTKAIKGILFNLSIPKRIHITTKSFEMMTRLRLLKIYWAHESISMRRIIKYLYWHGYPLESLPSSFYAVDLVELDMCYSNLKQLWESDLLLENLNTIRVSFSQHLMEIPDFSVSAPNLEKLILDGCSSLLEVHPSIGKLNKIIILNLKTANSLALYLSSTAIEELPSSIERHITRLVLLDLKRCKNLTSLPTCIFKLKSLEYLFMFGCSKLEKFPEIMEDMENLKELLLDGTSIEVLPSSIERLKGLVLLNLRKCKKLVSLPDSMCNLRSLQTLIVSGCSQLDQLPKNVGSLQHLVQLHADGTAITQPPDSIVLLRDLRVLIYPGCKILPSSSLSSLFSFWLLHRRGSNGIEIPELPPSVPDINSRDCTALSLSSSSISMLQWLQFLFYYCLKPDALQRFPDNLVSFSCSEPSLSNFTVLPTDWYDDDFLGLAVCTVLEHLPDRIICHLSADTLDYGQLGDFSCDFHCRGGNVSSEHVWLGYQPCAQLRMFQVNDPNEWSHMEISFEATHRLSSRASNVVKKCGVHFIHAKYLESIQCSPPLGSLGDSGPRVSNIVERSNDGAGPSGSGSGHSSVVSSQQSTNDPKLKLKVKYFPE
ncbi:hypothetical protein AAG906_012215 [Vitis piasezkii]